MDARLIGHEGDNSCSPGDDGQTHEESLSKTPPEALISRQRYICGSPFVHKVKLALRKILQRYKVGNIGEFSDGISDVAEAPDDREPAHFGGLYQQILT